MALMGYDPCAITVFHEMNQDYLANDSNLSYFRAYDSKLVKSINVFKILVRQYELEVPAAIQQLIFQFVQLYHWTPAMSHAHCFRFINAAICSMRMYCISSRYCSLFNGFRPHFINSNMSILSTSASSPQSAGITMNLNTEIKDAVNSFFSINYNAIIANRFADEYYWQNSEYEMFDEYESFSDEYESESATLTLFHWTADKLLNDNNMQYYNLLFSQIRLATLMFTRFLGSSDARDMVLYIAESSKKVQHAILFRNINAEICSLRMCCISDTVNINFYGLRHKIISQNINIISEIQNDISNTHNLIQTSYPPTFNLNQEISNALTI
jgi:hypothetical protein